MKLLCRGAGFSPILLGAMAVLGVLGAGRCGGRALLLAATLLLGCEGSEPSTSGEIFCDAMCERAFQCGGWSSKAQCSRECESDPNKLSDFRPDFIAEFAACFRKLDCATFFEQGSFDPCWDQAEDGFPPNDETRAFCRGWSATWFQCGAPYFPDECARSWATLAEPALDRVAACEQRPCEEIGSCASAAQAGE